MPERDPRAEADVLVRKAEDDANAVRLMAPDAGISDEIVGFHAQQAVEKWLKAVAIGPPPSSLLGTDQS